MLAHEFATRINSDGTLTVPEEIAVRIPAGQPVRVLVLIPESGEEEDWRRLTTEQFFQGYSAGDAIYDQLPTG